MKTSNCEPVADALFRGAGLNELFSRYHRVLMLGQLRNLHVEVYGATSDPRCQ